MQHQFFQQQGFTQPQPQNGIKDSPSMTYNTMLLEISNNWPFVRWTMDRHRNKELTAPRPIEGEWVKFLIENNIDIESHESSDLFLNSLWKE